MPSNIDVLTSIAVLTHDSYVLTLSKCIQNRIKKTRKKYNFYLFLAEV